MLIYNLNILFILIFAFVFYSKGATKGRTIAFVVLSFTQLFALSALRYGIGHDYFRYAEQFEFVAKTSFFDFSFVHEMGANDVGYILYMKFVALFTHNAQVYFAVTAALTLGATAYFISKHSKETWISVYLYTTIALYYATMNFVRQNLAVAILLLGYTFLKEKKFFIYTLFILAASAIHFSALIMLPLCFLLHVKINKITLIVYGAGTAFLFFTLNFFVDLAVRYLLPQYKGSVYLQESPLYFSILPLFFLGLALGFSKMLLQADERNRILINGSFYTFLIFLLMSRVYMMERFSVYVFFLVLLLIPEIVCVQRRRIDAKMPIQPRTPADRKLQKSLLEERKLNVAYVLVPVLIIALCYNFAGYYLGEKGFHGVFPYHTFL